MAEAAIPRRTVLFVDDDSTMRRAVRRLLAASSWNTLEAEDATMALEIASSTTPPIDVLLTDIVLPGLDGGQLAIRIRALHPSTRVIYTSGYGPQILAKYGIIDGEGRFLRKPYSAEELLQRLEEAVAMPPQTSP